MEISIHRNLEIIDGGSLWVYMRNFIEFSKRGEIDYSKMKFENWVMKNGEKIIELRGYLFKNFAIRSFWLLLWAWIYLAKNKDG